MTSIVAQDLQNGEHSNHKAFDPEQQRERALVAELPKSLGAGVSVAPLSPDPKPLIFSLSLPWL